MKQIEKMQVIAGAVLFLLWGIVSGITTCAVLALYMHFFWN